MSEPFLYRLLRTSTILSIVSQSSGSGSSSSCLTVSLSLLLIMPPKRALPSDIPVSNNGIISLPVTATENLRVFFLPDSLSSSICQILTSFWNVPSPALRFWYLHFCFCLPCNRRFLPWEFIPHPTFVYPYRASNTLFSRKPSLILLY